MDEGVCETEVVDPRRVWLANLPPRSTEFAVLQLIRQYGKLVDFNFPVHRAAGPLQGSTLGYCFVTFSTEEEARRALDDLNGRMFCGAVLSAQRARPTRDEVAQWTEARKAAQRQRIEADTRRREEELARRLNSASPSTFVTFGEAEITCLLFFFSCSSSRPPAISGRKVEAPSATHKPTLPDLYGKLGQISAPSTKSTSQPPPPNLLHDPRNTLSTNLGITKSFFECALAMSRAQSMQALRRIEAALRSSDEIALQPAILRCEKAGRRRQPHPAVAALLAGSKKPHASTAWTSGRKRTGAGLRNNPYSR
ncbi:unnamed protein product [Mesocestoides corti]|uniref:RRM domain-containing protein n=1 Tax=Mesocestoides corti TaxID=53468 RepID=A0A0R3ULN7_MESCO|nr:unnamed protein product [Mesocestoides corti]